MVVLVHELRYFLLAICLVCPHLQLRGCAPEVWPSRQTQIPVHQGGRQPGLIYNLCFSVASHLPPLFVCSNSSSKQLPCFVRPSPAIGLSGTISEIVVVGNASMYEICARVADNVGFKYKETREACYM